MVAEESPKTLFHVFHKVPAGDGLYVRAKHAQLVERNPEKAISLFWASLEAGDRTDSALKDLAIVLKQQNRPHDAILAISTFRSHCSESAQDSLDNVLLDLYKSSGRLNDQIALLIRKLRAFQNTQTFNGKRTKTARSQGKKFQVSVEQEVARLLGNLGWAYMQQSNYQEAESVYRRALALDLDSNKMCNLGICLIKQGRAKEAIAILQEAFIVNNKRVNSDSHLKSYERAQELIKQASAMLMSDGRLNSADMGPGSTCPQRVNSLNGGVELRSRFDRACDLRRATDTCIDAFSVTKADFQSSCSPIDDASKNDDADKISERVAAAWMNACCGDHRHDNQETSEFQAHDHSHENQETSEFQTQSVEEADIHSSSSYASLPPTSLSKSLLRTQVHASRRRLPVFRDITLLGSAAA